MEYHTPSRNPEEVTLALMLMCISFCGVGMCEAEHAIKSLDLVINLLLNSEQCCFGSVVFWWGFLILCF